MNKRICETVKTLVLPSAEDEMLAQLAQALGHPARLAVVERLTPEVMARIVAIVRLLQERQSCLCGDIVEVLPLAQSTVSQHLKVLKNAGWIQGVSNGPRVCYCINQEMLARFQKMAAKL